MRSPCLRAVNAPIGPHLAGGDLLSIKFSCQKTQHQFCRHLLRAELLDSYKKNKCKIVRNIVPHSPI